MIQIKGGKPSQGTSADRRLSSNKPKSPKVSKPSKPKKPSKKQ